MSNRVNLCAKISKEIHNKIKNGQAETELNQHQYIKKILTEYYQLKENGVTTMSKTMNQY